VVKAAIVAAETGVQVQLACVCPPSVRCFRVLVLDLAGNVPELGGHRRLPQTLGAGAAPMVRAGQTVTRLMPCSAANLDASFSRSTLETPYAHIGGFLALRNSTSDQELSSSV